MGEARMSRSELAEGLVMSLGTAAWYAMPDVVPSRRRRGLLKAGLAAGAAGWTAVRVAHEYQHEHDHEHGPDAGPLDPAQAVGTSARIRALTSAAPVLDGRDLGLDDTAGPPRSGLPWAPAALAAVGVAGVLAGTVAMERAIHGFGERLGARGVRAPHTRIGVAAGLAGVALSLGAHELEHRVTGRRAA